MELLFYLQNLDLKAFLKLILGLVTGAVKEAFRHCMSRLSHLWVLNIQAAKKNPTSRAFAWFSSISVELP